MTKETTMTADYLTEGWPLSPTSTIYMDGTAVYAALIGDNDD